MNLHSLKPRNNRLHGVLVPLPYEIRNTTGDWSPYFGQYESQKQNNFDTNDCWAFAMVECVEDELEFLWKSGQMSESDKKWFTDNGYIDSDGDFYISRRFIPILSGVFGNGNDQSEGWRLAETYGLIPQKMLPFALDYYNPSAITPAMTALGKEFLKRVKISHEELGYRWSKRPDDMIRAALFQSPLQIGIAIPREVSKWNNPMIQWDGSTEVAHSVELYELDADGTRHIYDTYEPHLKSLSPDYPLPIITKGLVYMANPAEPNPTPQETLGARIWRAIQQFFLLNPLWH